MEETRMKKIFLLTFIIIPLMFSSCFDSNPKNYAFISTASFSVPCMFRSDMRGGGYELLETDSYGRILGSMTDYCVFSGGSKTVLVVMQKYDDNSVYFYEDISYAFDDGRQETKTELKALNDWDLPLDESKMSKREVKYTLDNNLIVGSEVDFRRIEYQWTQDFKDSGNTIVDYSISDRDGLKHELYVIALETGAKEKEYYFAIVDIDSYELEYMKIEDINDYLEELIAFKQACNWHYGIGG